MATRQCIHSRGSSRTAAMLEHTMYLEKFSPNLNCAVLITLKVAAVSCNPMKLVMNTVGPNAGFVQNPDDASQIGAYTFNSVDSCREYSCTYAIKYERL